MLPGKRDAQGRLHVTVAAPGATSTLRGGIACSATEQVHITTTVSTKFVNGFMVSDTGQLVVGTGAIANYLEGIPRQADGAVRHQLNQTPAATDPYLGGLRIGPAGGVYTTDATPP